MRLLLVEDDRVLVNHIKPLLNKAGYAVELADNGIDGAFLGQEEDFDLVILDLGLEGKNGLEVLQEWRDADNQTPVLILTARDAWHERVAGLQAGADDYLGKPFHMEELLARVEAVIRRKQGKSNNSIDWQGVVLDCEKQQVTNSAGETSQLTGIEFRLLRWMIMHPEQIHSKTTLSEHIYEEEQLRDSNVIEVYINRLRQRLGKDFIQTRRGQGYILAPKD